MLSLWLTDLSAMNAWNPLRFSGEYSAPQPVRFSIARDAGSVRREILFMSSPR